MFNLERLVRPNIRNLNPYSSARSEFTGRADVYLDANENAYGSPAGQGLNRYPSSSQSTLKARLALEKSISPAEIFVGNGSDEAIDLLFRVFCNPGRDKVIVCPPTYGMYGVAAAINDIAVVEVPLTRDFQLDVPAILRAGDETTKLVFICSPNNPSGNLMSRPSVIEISSRFDGIVIVDEAYIDYADASSMIGELESTPNLVVMQTLSKAWGLAGLRVGFAFASAEIITLLDRVKPPYNVSAISQRLALDAIHARALVDGWITSTTRERAALAAHLAELEFVTDVYPSDANFLLVRVRESDSVYRYLIEKGIVVRDRSNDTMCEGCLRITVGTPEENELLIAALNQFKI